MIDDSATKYTHRVAVMAALTARVPNVLLLNRIISLQLTQLRYKRREPLRKHIWLPQAPSKLFKIPPKVELSNEEKEMLEQLEFRYNSTYTSIVNHCRQYFYLPTQLTDDEIESRKTQVAMKEEEIFKRRLKENNDENKRVAAVRLERRTKEMAELKTYLLEEKMKESAKNESLVEKAKKEVEIEMKRSETYLTKDKLEEAVEEALLHPVHYEWAVDWSGKVYSDGKIHPNAFKPTAVPETSSQKKLGMEELPSNLRLKAHKLY